MKQPDTKNEQQRREMMLTRPVEQLVRKMSVPTIMTMLITAIYNIADTYFVGQIDTIATASVGLTLPLMTIIQACGFFLGNGSGAFMSKKLGENDTETAGYMADTAKVLGFLLGSLLLLGCLFFLNPVIRMLGATPLLEETTTEYVQILIWGFPFQLTSFIMNNQFRFRGEAFKGMIGMAVGSFLNIGLDPLLMFGFGMGVKGAALATIISQIISFFVLLFMSGTFFRQKLMFRLNRENIGGIIQYGIPSLFRQGIITVAGIALNHVAGAYGESMIAAVSVVSKITLVGFSVMLGLGHGFQPVYGFNSGAKRYDRTYRLLYYCMRLGTVLMLIFAVVAFVFAGPLVSLFRDDPEVIFHGTRILRLQVITLPLMGLAVITNMVTQNEGQTLPATILAISRQGLFYFPALLLGSRFFGVWGVYLCTTIADGCTFLLSLPFWILTTRKIRKLAEAMKSEGMEKK